MKMTAKLKASLPVLLILLFFPAFANENPNLPFPPAERPDDNVVRILAIGNSFSEDAVEQYLYELAAADSIHVVIGNLYYPGCSLERHANNVKNDIPDYRYRKIVNGETIEKQATTIKQALANESWDYVSVQQASHFSGLPETYEPYLDELVEYVRQGIRKDTKLMFHMTWAYSQDSTHDGFKNYNNSQEQMYQAIVNATLEADKRIHFDLIIPSGTTIQNGRTSSIGDKWNRDGYHLNLLYGRYAAACTWFETIFKRSVLGNPYAPTGVTKLQKDIAQQAAHAACHHPFQVTPLTPVHKQPATAVQP